VKRLASTTLCLLLLAVLSAGAGAAPANPAAATAAPAAPAAATSPTVASPLKRRTARTRRVAVKPAAGTHTAVTHTAAKPAVPGMPRTLSDVHIEGEIPVPQVLFITARDQRRFMDFQHHRYLRSSTQLGEDTPFPTWVAVIHGSPADSRKETSR